MPMLALGRNPRLQASAFSCGEQRANNEKQAEKRVPSGRRYCDGFERNAGANQPTDGLHITF